MYGWQASWLEFLAVPMEHEDWPAAVLGIVANLGFLATFIAARAGRSKLAKRIAVTAAASAFGSVGLLALGANMGHFVPYPGCVLWLGTGVLLAFATRRLNAAEVAPDGPDPETSGTGRRTAPTAIRMDGEMSRKTKTATGVEHTLVSVVLGFGAFYLLGLGAFYLLLGASYLFNRPMDVTAFQVRLQRELQKESGWSDVQANYGGVPVSTRSNYDFVVYVSARKNNHVVETSLYQSEKYKLCYLDIDAHYNGDNQKEFIQVNYDDTGVVTGGLKVVEGNGVFADYPIMDMPNAMEAPLEGGIPLGNGTSFNNGQSQTVQSASSTLYGQELQAATLLADEFGFAVREALK